MIHLFRFSAELYSAIQSLTNHQRANFGTIETDISLLVFV